jgi:hypothetical protein
VPQHAFQERNRTCTLTIMAGRRGVSGSWLITVSSVVISLIGAIGACGEPETQTGAVGSSGSGSDSAGTGSQAGEGGSQGEPANGGVSGAEFTAGTGGQGGAAEGGADAGAGTGAAGGSGDGGSVGDCLIDRECAGGESCTDGTLEMVCVRARDACGSHDDCELFEYCDGFCKPANGLGALCSPGERCARETGTPYVMPCVDGYCTSIPPYPEPCIDDEGVSLCGPSNLCVGDFGVPCEPGIDDCQCMPFGALEMYCDTYCSHDVCGTGYANPEGCDPGLWCDRYYPGQYHPRGFCVEKAPAGAGCERDGATPVCLEGHYCREDLVVPEGRTCLLSPGENEPCLDVALCHNTEEKAGCSPCAPGLYCDEETCRRMAAYGEACVDRECGEGLRCATATVGGHCSEP